MTIALAGDESGTSRRLEVTMPDVESIVRDPLSGLLSPYVFWVLLGVTVMAMWSRRTWPSVIAVVLIAGVVIYREQMLYTFLRIMVERTGPGKTFSQGEFEGARLMYTYSKRTALYSVGGAGLLSTLAIVGRLRARRKGSTGLGPADGAKGAV
jgi:hypothetical protein